jgi:hypothetical protein
VCVCVCVCVWVGGWVGGWVGVGVGVGAGVGLCGIGQQVWRLGGALARPRDGERELAAAWAGLE